MRTPSADTAGRVVGRQDFARAFRLVPAAVSVVLARSESGVVRGITCTSVSSLSATPPMALFSVDHKTRFADDVRSARHYSINILAADREEWARAFSRGGRSLDDLAHAIHAGRGPAPVLAAGTAVVLECVLEGVYPGGDHSIVTGRITHLRVQSDAPVLQYRSGEYGHFAPDERSS